MKKLFFNKNLCLSQRYTELCHCEEPKRRSNLTSEITLKLFGLPRRNFVSPRNDANNGKSCLQFTVYHSPHPAFTLSEVLITLGIIGVIAAITIPNLIKEYQKQQTATQVEKAFANINEAINRSRSENGPPETWNWPSSGATALQDTVETYLIPYFSISKNCGYNSSANECSNAPKKYLNETTNYSWGNGLYHIILNDGTYVGFHFNSFPTGLTTLMILVDLNGNVKPNLIGKDVFQMRLIILSGKIIFIGQDVARNLLLNDVSYGCNKTAPQAGYYCGALIQRDGWQIKDDYPWD